MNVENMPIKLFLGGLPGSITTEQLLDALGYPYPVRVNIKRRRDDTSSLGYAFIIFYDNFLAHSMVNMTYLIQGRKLILQYCKRDSPDQIQTIPEAGRLFVRGIPSGTDDEELSKFFSACVPCKSAYSIRDKKGHSKGYGFVELWNQADANYLATFNHLNFRGFNLELEHYRKKNTNSELEVFENNQKDRLHREIATSGKLLGTPTSDQYFQIDRRSTCVLDRHNSPSFSVLNKLRSHQDPELRLFSGQKVLNKNVARKCNHKEGRKVSKQHKPDYSLSDQLKAADKNKHNTLESREYLPDVNFSDRSHVDRTHLGHSTDNVRFNILRRRNVAGQPQP